MRNRNPLLPAAVGLLVLCASMAARADYQSAILADNPSGYWRLNAKPPPYNAANSGWAGNAVDGAIGSWTREGVAGAIVGDANTAMQFVGNGNSRVTIPYSYDINSDPAMGQSFTWEGWVKSESHYGEALGIVVNRSGESGYVIYVQGDGILWFGLNRGPSGGYWAGVNVAAADYAQLVGKWFHLACVYDYSAGVGFGAALIYTNGVLCASNAIPDALPLVNPNGPMVLGDRNYNGTLDEVAVYTNALDAATILSHYQAGTNGSGTYAATILAANPPGYWRLGETAGVAAPATLADNLGTLGSVADGNYAGVTTLQAPGALGGVDAAASFAGGYVVVPQNSALNPDGPFTVEAWMKPATAQTGTGLVCPVSSWEDLSSVRSGWLIYQSASGWNFRTYNKNGTSVAVSITGGPAPVVGTWYHVAAVWDGSVGTIYVNGVPTSSAPTNYIATRYRPLTIGARSDGGFAWAGTQDEVAFYNGVLSAGTIMAHYQAASTNAGGYATQILADSPVGYWRLNDVAPAINFAATNLGYIGAAGSGVFNGTSMVVTNDTPLVGDSDAALYFPASSRIDIPLHEALVRTNAFSYEIWYKENPGVTGIRSPMWWRDGPATGDTRGWVHYLQDLAGGRGHNFQSSGTVQTWDGMWVVPMSFAQDVWQHLVCTWDGRVKKIYLDAALVQVSTNDPRYIKLVQRATCSISSGSYPFSGFLDEAAYYTNALTAERVLAHYVAARGANPPAVAPTFKLDAVGTIDYEGAVVTVPTIVLGTPPFTYQWYKGAIAVSGQTTATLTLSPAVESDSGDYKLVVNNAGGSVESQVATVLILKAPPTIVVEPQPAVRLQGSSVTFAPQCGGSLPLYFQWYSNGVAIAGANAATLTLNNLQPSFTADYSLTITNVAGSASSQPASLTVVPVGAGSLAAAVVAAQPVAYWRLDEPSGSTVAHDYVGGHDGMYDPNVMLEQPGAILGDSNGSAAFLYGGITVPYSADLNPLTTFSLEVWAKADPTGMGIERPILWSANTYFGWAYGYVLSANVADAWAFTTGQKTSGFNTLTGGATTSEGWTHLVCTFDDATGDKRLYINGQLAAQTTTAVGTFGRNPPEGTPDNPFPIDQGIGLNVRDYTSYVGGLDEVVFYNYALSPEQIGTHYAAGSSPTLTIAPVGGQVVVTWSQGLLLQASDLNGPWTTNTTASSPYTNTPSQSMQFFRALVP